jgi:multiple sugar transport system ATP-binding protein
MNLIDVKVDDNGAVLGNHNIPVPREILSKVQAEGANSITLGMRPEDLRISSDGFEMVVDLVELLGADAFVYGEVTDINGETRVLTVRADGRISTQRGETVRVSVNNDNVHAFSVATGLSYSL